MSNKSYEYLCLQCGEKFTSKRRGVKYCSEKCRRIADRENHKIKYKWKSPKSTCCIQCGKKLDGRKAKFCSRECISRYYAIKDGRTEDHGELTKICPICGKTFYTWKSKQIVCSSYCSQKRSNQKKRETNLYRNQYLKNHPEAETKEEIHKKKIENKLKKFPIKQFRKEIQQRNRAKIEEMRALSREERERKKQENIKHWLEYRGVHKCIECGKEYIAKYPGTLYCSDRCKRAKNNKGRYKGITKDKDITLIKLAKRDHDICQICGLKVDWTDFTKTEKTIVCGDMYPSIDHIKPISKGGLHAWDNVQLAHRVCNYLKSDKE